MWLGDEFEEADLEVAAQGWRSPDTAPAPTAASSALELSYAELAQLAEDEGWDLAEVEAIRRLLGRPSDTTGPDPETPPPMASSAGPASEPSRAAPASDSAPTTGISGTSQEHDPDGLLGRNSAAAEAYRRLRKLFPS